MIDLFNLFKPSGDTVKGVLNGASNVVKSVGAASTRIREAITGDLPSDVKLKLEEIASELEKQKTELDKTVIETTNQINLEYAKKNNWFFSGWRPAFAWIGVIAFLLNYIIFPLSNLLLKYLEIDFKLEINVGELYPLVISLLGLGTLRTAEKKANIHNSH